MAIVKCKECGGEVSTKAAACPKCGARQPKQTSTLTWIALGLIVITVAVMMFTVTAEPTVSACRPVDPASLWLPEEKGEARRDFVARAERLNASGKCVIEGSFGSSYQKFYFAVRDGPNGKPYFIRFSREELAKN